MRYVLHMLFCRRPEMIRLRHACGKYFVYCSRCDYSVELVKR